MGRPGASALHYDPELEDLNPEESDCLDAEQAKQQVRSLLARLEENASKPEASQTCVANDLEIYGHAQGSPAPSSSDAAGSKTCGKPGDDVLEITDDDDQEGDDMEEVQKQVRDARARLLQLQAGASI